MKPIIDTNLSVGGMERSSLATCAARMQLNLLTQAAES